MGAFPPEPAAQPCIAADPLGAATTTGPPPNQTLSPCRLCHFARDARWLALESAALNADVERPRSRAERSTRLQDGAM
eukprot:2175197-Rhodomonas_salina.1